MATIKLDSVDERIEKLEDLLKRSQSRKVLLARIEGLNHQKKNLRNELSREKSWSYHLDSRVEELEHVLGVVHEQSVELCKLIPVRLGDIRAGMAQKIQDRLAKVLDVEEENRCCPSCGRNYAN